MSCICFIESNRITWRTIISEYKIPHLRFMRSTYSASDIALLKHGDVLLCITYGGYKMIHDNKDALDDRNVKYLCPSLEIYDLLNSKIQFAALMRDHFSDYSPRIYDYLPDSYPFICKQDVGEYGYGCHIIKNTDDLSAFMQNNPNYIKKYTIQEMIPGNLEYTAHLLVVDGIIKYSLVCEMKFTSDIFVKGHHTRFILKRKYTERHNYFDAFESILSKLSYSGLCCVNYKVVDNTAKIFEINPRIGSSLMYDKTSMEDFIDKYIEVMTGKSPSKSSIESPVKSPDKKITPISKQVQDKPIQNRYNITNYMRRIMN